MANKSVLIICLLTILVKTASSQRTETGYIYQQNNGPDFSHQSQDLHPPLPQQPIYTQDTNYYQKGQLNLPYIQNPVNFATHQQPSLNFQLPTAPQVNNIHYSPPQQFNPQAAQNDDIIRLQFDIQGNSIEPGCNPEPIIGQFKPELVDLANGGPLTRVIETCGPGSDCKTIALQSDLNRVQAVLPKLSHNRNGPHTQEGFNRGIEGRGNAAGAYVHAADVTNSLIRPPNRRLIEYTEILQDDIYN